ncbi:hypothetical protein Bca101_014090 [Brassica carinata]
MSAPAKKSSTEAKEKDLNLDNDMEKDTWNFADDPMDFAFESPANKKKNAFKMDMGFDLDGDFGNVSSFKVDMPDFDFPSPAKKTTKTKESPGDKSRGDLKQKKNLFDFSYDFDTLDDFNLDSSPPKKATKTTTKVMDFEEISAVSKIDKSDSLDFGQDLPITRKAASVSNTDVKEKVSAEKENLNSKTTDTMVVDSSAHSKQATEESVENSEAVESPQGIRIKTSPTPTMCLQPQSVDASPLKTSCAMLEDTDDPCLLNETAAPSPLHASENTPTAANREPSPDFHEICRSSSNEDCPGDTEQNANNDKVSNMDSSYENAEQTKPSISSQLCLDKMDHQQEEMGTGTQAEEQDHTRRASFHPDHGHLQPTLSGKVSPGSRLSQAAQLQVSSGKLPLDPSHSVPGLSDLKTTQNKDSGLVRSKFFKKIEKTHSHVLESSLTQTESRPVTREKIAVNMNLSNDRRTIGVTKDQSSSLVQPLVNSTISKERGTEATVKKGSETPRLAPRDKTQLLDYPSSLKRKALDEFSSQESRINNNNTTKELVKESPRSTSYHQITNMANLEIPVTENSDNIEKAEAYTKELESICNTLKKKHEEAKELLVRAVVNNNKLLMLNHPLHEEKISF